MSTVERVDSGFAPEPSASSGLTSATASGLQGKSPELRNSIPDARALFQEITAARRVGSRGDVELEWGPRRVLLRRDAGPEVIQAVVLVAQDLALKARRYAELDARYAGQVVVRRRAGP